MSEMMGDFVTSASPAPMQAQACAKLSTEVHEPQPVCILLVDDHALFRAGMRFILGEGVLAGSCVLEAGQVTNALALPEAGDAVQVVLLDVQLPGVNGVEGLSLIKRRWPRAAVLMLSAQEDTQLQQLALRRGARAFVSKSASPEQIREMVWQAARGQPLRTSSQADSRPQAQGMTDTDTDADADENTALSARQLQVLLLMCEGISNKAIARRLFVSENTVRTHVAAVMKHLVTMFMVCMVCGISAAAVPIFGTRPQLYLLMFIPIYAAQIVVFSLHGWRAQDGFHALMGVAMLLLLTVNLIFSRFSGATFRRSIELAYDNEELVQQLKRQAEQLTEQTRAAQEANVAKTKFLAAASHDLRQPVHALNLFVEVLAGTALSDKQASIVQHIRSATQQTATLLHKPVNPLLLRQTMHELQASQSVATGNKR
jgi:DNA-binding NarL/FixJ family response regulator